MRLLIQWTLVDPPGWEEVNILRDQHWRSLPFKDDPTNDPTAEPDNEKGWVFALGCQGLTFSGDHYAVSVLGDGGLRIWVVNDDPVDWPEGQRHVKIWDLHPITKDAEGKIVNTDQELRFYSEISYPFPIPQRTATRPVIRGSWGERLFPHTQAIRHGLQVSDELALLHKERQTLHTYMDWA